MLRDAPRRRARCSGSAAASRATTPHGHVDDLARFVDAGARSCSPPRTIRRDANYEPLRENRERLEGARDADGRTLEVVAAADAGAARLRRRAAAGELRQLLRRATRAVLVPTFNDPNDRVALGILAELFPDRQVVGIHAVDLVWGLGTLHCMTQQQPKAELSPGSARAARRFGS